MRSSSNDDDFNFPLTFNPHRPRECSCSGCLSEVHVGRCSTDSTIRRTSTYTASLIADCRASGRPKASNKDSRSYSKLATLQTERLISTGRSASPARYSTISSTTDPFALAVCGGSIFVCYSSIRMRRNPRMPKPTYGCRHPTP